MWSIIGHDAALQALQRALASERPPHAWLFSGPEGIGKQTVALEFAAALNCTSETSQSPAASAAPAATRWPGSHPDVEVVAPGGICDEPEHKDHTDSRDLRICQIRRLERLLSLSPYAGGRRVAIVDAADTLHVEAANAFLKTLEEPPAGSVIILLAEREERLPETVLSRCQTLAFRPVERETIVETLIERGADARRRRRRSPRPRADASAGRCRPSRTPACWTSAARCSTRPCGSPTPAAPSASPGPRTPRAAHAGVRERYLRELTLWESWWRDVLLYGAGGGTKALTTPTASRICCEEGKLYPASEIVTFLRIAGADPRVPARERRPAARAGKPDAGPAGRRPEPRRNGSRAR